MGNSPSKFNKKKGDKETIPRKAPKNLPERSGPLGIDPRYNEPQLINPIHDVPISDESSSPISSSSLKTPSIPPPSIFAQMPLACAPPPSQNTPVLRPPPPTLDELMKTQKATVPVPPPSSFVEPPREGPLGIDPDYERKNKIVKSDEKHDDSTTQIEDDSVSVVPPPPIYTEEPLNGPLGIDPRYREKKLLLEIRGELDDSTTQIKDDSVSFAPPSPLSEELDMPTGPGGIDPRYHEDLLFNYFAKAESSSSRSVEGIYHPAPVSEREPEEQLDMPTGPGGIDPRYHEDWLIGRTDDVLFTAEPLSSLLPRPASPPLSEYVEAPRDGPRGIDPTYREQKTIKPIEYNTATQIGEHVPVPRSPKRVKKSPSSDSSSTVPPPPPGVHVDTPLKGPLGIDPRHTQPSLIKNEDKIPIRHQPPVSTSSYKRPLGCAPPPPPQLTFVPPPPPPVACAAPPPQLPEFDRPTPPSPQSPPPPPVACAAPPPQLFYAPLPTISPVSSSLASLSVAPKPSSLELINLSIDLFPVAKHLFRFLEAIDEVPRDPIKNLMAFALHRYNKWLDFINWCIETGQDDIDHRPPFDIEVVWVAHVIRTDEYKSDCLRLFGREIPHVFDHKSGAHTSVSETTRKLWKERTGSDLVMNTEKFFNLASVFASNLASGTISDQNKTSITVCILIEDMKWFHDFRDFYPRSLVSLLSNTPSPIASSSSASEEEEIQQNLKREFGAKETPLDLEISESDKTFLEEAHRDYLRFLALQKKYNFTRGVSREEGAGKICATYKIDLFWHSHMLNTREYRRDCESYLGDIVPHAPWPTEAVESLNNKFNFTGDLWQREFGDEFQATKP